MQFNRDYLRAKGGFPYRGPFAGHGIDIRDAALNLRTGRDLDRNLFSALRQAGRNVSGHCAQWLLADGTDAYSTGEQQKQSDAVSGKPRFAIFGVFLKNSMLAVFFKK